MAGSPLQWENTLFPLSSFTPEREGNAGQVFSVLEGTYHIKSIWIHQPSGAEWEPEAGSVWSRPRLQSKLLCHMGPITQKIHNA